jgi:endonuclease/exonuclease/phosphatase family metal-dependent hydrolase
MRALSFNVAGVPIRHKNVRPRFHGIAERIRAEAYDIVALQEVWVDSFRGIFTRKAGLAHHAHLRAGPIWSAGLLTLSRYPIVETHQHVFAPFPVGLETFVCRKGILMTRLRTPGGPLDVYNTHFLDDDGGRQALKLHRQILDLLGMISRLSAGVPAVLMGDLNLASDCVEVGIIKDFLGLRDGGFHGGLEVCGRTDVNLDRRVDYILVPEGPAARLRRAFTDRLRLGEREVPFSDHPAGVESELEGLTAGVAPRRLAALARLKELLLGAGASSRLLAGHELLHRLASSGSKQ